MKPGTKLIVSLLSLAFVITLVYQGYILFHFRLHRDYKDVLSSTALYEEGTPFSGTADVHAPDGMVLAAKSEVLKLFVNPNTTEAAVYDIRTGITTYTNPPGAADDPLAAGVNKSILQSQIIVEFYDTRRALGRYNSYDLSVLLGQFEFESLDNGLRVNYVIGDTSSPTGIVPMYISEERLALFMETMSDGGRYVRARYVESAEAPGFLQLIESAVTGQATLRRMIAFFEESGYTDGDYADDMAESNVEGAARINFFVPLEYRLDGDSLVVSVPATHVEERGGGSIARIQVLRSFGAGSEEEEGFMLIPNGSGSLIYFNNGKTHADDYNQYIYGQDPMLSEYIQLGITEDSRMPYFGIQRESQGIIAEIESGDTLADIYASVAGKLNSYNYVFPSFTLRGTNSLAMFGSTGNEAELPVIEAEFARINLTVRYSFLTDEYKGYAGMANYLRERLIEGGVLIPKAETGDIPFYMDLIGSISGQKHFLSVAYRGHFAMTTFEQASDIITELFDAGITNQVVNYQGWFNRGYYHDVPDKIKIQRNLGSKKEFEALSAQLEAQGGKLYGDVVFQHVTFMSERFNWQMETSRYYGGGMLGILGETDPVTLRNTGALGYLENMKDLLSPKFLGRYTDKFIKAAGKYDITGISLRDMGNELHSDRKRTEVINREEAKEIVLDSIGKLYDTGKDLMFSGGNSYVLQYSADLINAPTAHNAIYIVDEEVPFYNMIIHGCLDYAGSAVNLSDAYDEDELVVRLIEFGAAPHFTFTYESVTAMKYTAMNKIYGATFDNWKSTAVSIYDEVNSVLRLVTGSFIVNHEILGNGIRRITYENGTVIEINRDKKTYEVKGG